ncbi:hypothetical protein Ccrd_011908 [Cynara cardunculus var. scolymus]|uniref:Uncharacterized protein n=1 Tax=Cynara cardunculus var. scolymus TaxID=59895 RepID=A0A103YIF3_CYNCS|nr:hypothetical protein Ccrd_011908 [Cynara cardunculus var. scolymus]
MTRTNREMVQIFFLPNFPIIVFAKTLFPMVNSSMSGNVSIDGFDSMKDQCRIHGRTLRRVVFQFTNSVKMYQNPTMLISCCSKRRTLNFLIGRVET